MEPRKLVLLAFVGITVLTALVVLAAASGLLKGIGLTPHPMLVKLGFPGVIVEIVATVIMFFKAQWGSQVDVNLTFEDIDALDIDFDTSNCHYAIVDFSGKEVDNGNVNPTLAQGGWSVRLPVSVNANQSVSLTLMTQNDERWQVRPFLPLVHTQTAVRLA